MKISKNIGEILKIRELNSNKWDYGHTLIIAGNKGKVGCAIIAAKACLRSGAGLLTVNLPEEERFALQTVIPESMLMTREKKEYDFTYFSAIGIGPGIGINKDSEKLLIYIFTEFKKPLLLDADALNILGTNRKLYQKIPEGTIITPHIKEFDRLFGNHNNSEKRIETAIKKAKKHNMIIVLKSHQTTVISKDEIFLNTTGNPGLAKAGSGDALTGIITAFLAQNYEPFHAAKLGVYLHGLAADITLKTQSMESMLITDVIENLGEAFKHYQKNNFK